MSSLKILLFLLIASAAAAAQTNDRGLFRDPSKPLEARVDDLVSRMTLAEKISQMQNNAPAIARLGIPEYDWWNEALHGVARAGIATVFPQAIGLAATFDEPLILRTGDVISTEARAKYHESQRRMDFSRYKGLTFWSPNINIFRDPRWGRGQETWGEDPFLAGYLGGAFVRGLQGSDPKYLKTVSTVKHFAVHSGPEPERHGFNAIVSERDLRETYLPAFRSTLLDSKAVGVMCAYNAVNGEPACMNTTLMRGILRGEWKFSGHVVSDCGAVQDIWKGHKYFTSEVEAASAAVRNGTDLTCGDEYPSLNDAVKRGLISEKEIDDAVRNLFRIRFRLGMFDPPSVVAWTKIPFSANDSAAHHELSLEAARKSLVLLKNESNALPLAKNVGAIAVLGPLANDADVLLGNYNGAPSVSVTALAGIKDKVSNKTEVHYAPAIYAPGVDFEPIAAAAFADGVEGRYFNNPDFSGTPALVRRDAQINFNWGSFSPDKRVNDDGFSVRWTGRLTAAESGKYLLGWRGNGQVSVWIDGKLLLEENRSRRTRNQSIQFEFTAGKSYEIRVDYVENRNEFAQSRLVWAPPSSPKRMYDDALDKARKADVVVIVAGITPSVEGEEMPVKLDGFRGGDRTSLDLPKAQQKLIEDVVALGKKVVLVTMGGSALALNRESEIVPAIVHAWYPGQFGGTAIADVLFGDYNPAGRLPVTFYKSVSDLPPFEDYSMKGRTYRYFEGSPLFGFGHGLSYTRFEYSDLSLPNRVAAGGNITASVRVRNAGRVAGDEVVQFYLSDTQAGAPVPIRSLVAVSRVFLKPNESRIVKVAINARQMSMIADDNRRIVEPGEFLLTAGGRQPEIAIPGSTMTSGVVSRKFTVTGRIFEIGDR